MKRLMVFASLEIKFQNILFVVFSELKFFKGGHRNRKTDRTDREDKNQCFWLQTIIVDKKNKLITKLMVV